MSKATSQLVRGLTRRHIRFIALGSAIGTGLFYGSAGAIKTAGPSVILAYFIGGAAIFIVMRALGEMAVEHPTSASFGSYAGRYLNPGIGFITGWVYVIDLLIVVLADLTAVGIYMGFWFPDVPRWIWVLSVIILIGLINLLHVKVFGELEFWLAAIKITAILAMIAGGIILLMTGFSGSSPALLWNQGGFFPNGFSGFTAAFVLVLFGFGGIEIIGITAAEAENPEKNIPMAINSVPMRVLLFYVGSLTVLMALRPWQTIGEEGSPFVMIFEHLGIGIAAAVLNVVVLSAAISAINADIFATGRMAYGLAMEGQGPRVLTRCTPHGVPYLTALAMTGAMLLAVVLNALVPEQLFEIFASLVVFVTLWVWVSILLSHWSMRRRREKAGVGPGRFRQPLFPISTIVVLAFFAYVIVTLALNPTYQIAFIVGLATFAILGVAYVLWSRRHPEARRYYEEEELPSTVPITDDPSSEDPITDDAGRGR